MKSHLYHEHVNLSESIPVTSFIGLETWMLDEEDPRREVMKRVKDNGIAQ